MSNAPLAIDFASHTNMGARALLATNNLGKAVCTAIDKTMAFYDMHRGVKAAFMKTFGTVPTTRFGVVQDATGISMRVNIPNMGAFNRSFAIGVDYGQGVPRDVGIKLKFGKDFDEHGFRNSAIPDAIVDKINYELNCDPPLLIKANNIHGAAISDVLRELIRDPSQNPADFFKAKPADPSKKLHA